MFLFSGYYLLDIALIYNFRKGGGYFFSQKAQS